MAVDPLVSSALEQAEQSAPAVKAAALLSVARVGSARSRDEGLRVLEHAIATAQTLREPARHVLLGAAFTEAAALSPDHAFALLPEIANEAMTEFRIQWGLQRMIEHGHHPAAIRYLLSAPEQEAFPFDVAGSAIAVAGDDETKRALLRKAIRAVRHSMRKEKVGLHHALSEFLTFFAHHWRAVPADEARALLREVVAGILAAEDQRGQFTPQGVRFSSTRQYLLFQLFAPLRHLEPQLAASLASEHAQLAKAVARFPYGLESIEESVQLAAMEHAPHDPPPAPDRTLCDELGLIVTPGRREIEMLVVG